MPVDNYMQAQTDFMIKHFSQLVESMYVSGSWCMKEIHGSPVHTCIHWQTTNFSVTLQNHPTKSGMTIVSWTSTQDYDRSPMKNVCLTVTTVYELFLRNNSSLYVYILSPGDYDKVTYEKSMFKRHDSLYVICSPPPPWCTLCFLYLHFLYPHYHVIVVMYPPSFL